MKDTMRRWSACACRQQQQQQRLSLLLRQRRLASPLSLLRPISYVTTAANFEQEVIQSQQAICLVYYIPSSASCTSYLHTAESLVDQLNAETTGNDVPPPPAASSQQQQQEEDGGSGRTSNASRAWLKLCTINADDNRNLASAFSVERAKLPVTYFVMQGTIVDRVTGHIAPARLQGILVKFLEHYQKELNVDLLAKRNKESIESHGTRSPLPAASAVDLLQGTSTQFLQNKVMAALVGLERIELPAEASQLDGLRKTLQQAKRKASEELAELQHELGMDTRKLSDAQLHAQYYKSGQFTAMGLLSALEALYLARCYAALGDVARQNVVWARRALQIDFEPMLADTAMRRTLVLIDANLLRGELQHTAQRATQQLERLTSGEDNNKKEEEEQQMRAALHAHVALCQSLLQLIAEHIDVRVFSDHFPTGVAEELFGKLKEALRRSKPQPQQPQQPEKSTSATSDDEDDKAVSQAALNKERVRFLREALLCLVQLHATDAASQTMRSRLASLLY